jgi:hypothetical protein
MLKRTTFALLLSLPLCAFASGGSLFHSSPANEPAAEVTTWRGERALKIPVQLSAVDWSKAGFAASNNAETQTAWLYITETAFQLQDGGGHTLMGGPRSDIGLETSQCIRMRSMKVSVCANSSFPATKEAREMLHGSQTEFSWLYYHLAMAGKNAPAAPNGTMMLAGAPGANSSSNSNVAPPVLECRLVNPDGSTAIALGGPGVNPAAPNAPAAAKSEPLVMADSPAAVSMPTPAPAKADVAVHVAEAPPVPQIDHAQHLRAMAASSHPALMYAAGKQPSAMLESSSGTMASMPLPHMPIHVEEHDIAPAAPIVAAAAPHVATHSTMNVSAATPAPAAVAHMPASVPAQPKPMMAAAPKAPAPVAAAASQPAPEDTAEMASDDLTPAGAPRGVVPERRMKVVTVSAAAKPADSHTALVQAEKEARAARVAEMQLKHAQDLSSIPSTSERKKQPLCQPHNYVHCVLQARVC